MIAFGKNILVNVVNESIEFATEDTLVNPLNTYLLLSMSDRHISGIVRRKCGVSMQRELEDRKSSAGELEPGDVLVTGAYDWRPIRTIVHTATKDPGEGNLEKSLNKILDMVCSHQIPGRSIAMPLIGCGTGRMDPKEFLQKLNAVCQERENSTWNRFTIMITLYVPEKETYEQLMGINL